MNIATYENRYQTPKKFTVEYCHRCQVTKLLPEGETWNHECTNPVHQLIWLNELYVGCVGCDWRRSRPNRHDLRPYNLKEMWKSAHRVEDKQAA